MPAPGSFRLVVEGIAKDPMGFAGIQLEGAGLTVLGEVEGWAGSGGPQDDMSVVALEVERMEPRGE